MTTTMESHAHPPDEAKARFGRGRLLAVLGAGMFGVATRSIVSKNPAWANHTIPGPWCFGPVDWEICPCCYGAACTCATCGYYHYEGCPSGEQYWEYCMQGYLVRCRDWMYTVGSTWKHCLCAHNWGPC